MAASRFRALHVTVPRAYAIAWPAYGAGVLAVVAGIGAAVLPARRAARLNVLQALQYE